jgi:hypothetical protein
MSSGISQAYRKKLMDHLFKNTSLSQPSALWVGLYTTAPASSGGGTEASYTGYARVQCDDWDDASSADPSVVKNTSAVTFASAGSSATAVAFGIFTASAAGDMIAYGACTGNISSGITPQFAASALSISMNQTA